MKLVIGQKKTLSEFFTNGAVAWLSAGLIAPFFFSPRPSNIFNTVGLGFFFTVVFVAMSLLLMRGVKS